MGELFDELISNLTLVERLKFLKELNKNDIDGANDDDLVLKVYKSIVDRRKQEKKEKPKKEKKVDISTILGGGIKTIRESEVHPLTLGGINHYFKNDKFYQGTHMSNALPKKLKNQAIIINLEDIETNGNGTHWVCALNKNGQNYYYDSFGVPPDDDVLEMFKNSQGKSYYNDSQQQKIESIRCGYFCIYVINKIFKDGWTVKKTLNSMGDEPSNKNEELVVEDVKDAED